MEQIYPEPNEKQQYQQQYQQEEQQEPLKSEEQFEKEFYEPAVMSRTTNIVGWSIATVMFILAIWLLWVALG